MSRIQWDQVGEHLYETGVDHGVLYLYNTSNKTYDNGVAWNGLTAVTENPSGAEATPLYADNIKYLNLMSAETYGLTIEAYTYPDEFEECDGSRAIATGVLAGQQPRKMFGFSYRTLIGDDTQGTDKGYKLHLVYNCLASPAERAHNTVNDSPEAANPSWTVSTTPVDVAGMKPTACITIDSTKVDSAKLTALEEVLYGKDAVAAQEASGTTPAVEAQDAVAPKLPLPAEVITIFSNNSNSGTT